MTDKQLDNSPSGIDLQELVTVALHAVKLTWDGIREYQKLDPEGAFEVVLIGEQQKKALKIDISAEKDFECAIKRYKSKKFLKVIAVYGEEKLRDPDLNLENQAGVFALADMIDGTDLLERRLSNWCSAVVFFEPLASKGKRILASFVALPSGRVYYATAQDETVKTTYINHRKREVKNIAGVSRIKKLQEASVCFYGQKAQNFTDISKYPIFQHLKNGKLSGNFRLYTLAGIPMVINLIDHEVKTGKNIDAVFDVSGQKPHDVVPGAFLAMKAGACLKNLDTGNDLTLEDLEDSLLRPSSDDSELKYVIASTPELLNELSEMLVIPKKT